MSLLADPQRAVRALTFSERVAIDRKSGDLVVDCVSALPEILNRDDVAGLLLKEMGLTRKQLQLAYSLEALSPAADMSADAATRDSGSVLEEFAQYHERRTNLERIVCELLPYLCRQELQTALAEVKRPCEPMVISETLAVATFFARAIGDAAQMMADTIRFEGTLALTQGLLDGGTGSDCIDELAKLACSREYREYLLEKYPMLIRRVRDRLKLLAQSHALLIHRLVLDRDLIARDFDIPAQEVYVTGLTQTEGDSHNGAQSVTIIELSGNRKLVYKPRSLSAEAAFQRYLAWVNGICPRVGLRLLTCLARGPYGWMEYVHATEARSVEDIRAYYYRFGALMAACHVIQGTDLHYDNLVASCDQPVPIDLETIFHPLHFAAADTLSNATDKLQIAAAGASIYFTGLLDVAVFTQNEQRLSPLAGPVVESSRQQELERLDRELALHPVTLVRHDAHCLRYSGRCVNAPEYAREIVRGFRYCYTALLHHRQELLEGTLAGLFGEITVRVVLRETSKYGKLLKALNSAYAGESFHSQDEYLHKLWLTALDQPALARVITAEIEDTLLNDVPYFSARVTSCDVMDSRGRSRPALLEKSGMEAVKERLCQMSLGALEREVACIEHALLAPRTGERRLRSSVARRIRRFPADVATFFRDLNAELRTKHVVDLAPCRDGRTIRHRPMGNDLYDGLPGLCFALAFHGHATGDEESTANARRLAADFFVRLDIEAHDFTIGAGVGIGGWIWLAAHLAALWESAFYLEMASMLARRLMAIHSQDCHYDIVYGAAGGLLAMDALYSISRDELHLDGMARLATFIFARHVELKHGIAWHTGTASSGPTTGFAHGASGIGYALLRAYERVHDPQLLYAAKEVHRFLQRCYVPETEDWLERADGAPIARGSWCHGAPGISLFYEKLHSITRDPQHDAALKASLRRTGDGLILDNECLCHGTLGNAEVFLAIARSRLRRDLAPTADDALASITSTLQSMESLRCGTPHRHPSLSLFNGFAGIGYQLVRLRERKVNLPAVLTFDACVTRNHT